MIKTAVVKPNETPSILSVKKASYATNAEAIHNTEKAKGKILESTTEKAKKALTNINLK